jgi:cyclophilin family peptidyl-prolyl cis-trans isomerase/HEAT repeat protein
MKHTCIFFILSVVFLLHSTATAHIKFTEAERTIIRLQDERRGIDTIEKFLDSKDEKVAWRAAIALANIHDTTSRGSLVAHLAKETRPYVIDGIAFALGVLGPDAISANAIFENMPKNRYSEEMFIGLARTFPKENIKDLNLILGAGLGSRDKKPSPPHSATVAISSALLQMGLRKLIDEDDIGMCGILESDNDPIVRWHCAYALSRTEDSALLSRHIDLLKLFLSDIGSPESRMFAATALGRIHNEEVAKILIDAARSETEWRVRVNIINAIGKLSRYSSAIGDVLKKAVMESSKDNPIGDHIASTALDVLSNMITAGKISSPDSVTIREWLADYEPERELHEDQSIHIRSQCMIPLAHLGADFLTIREICSYITFNDRNAEINVWKAVGLIPDTLSIYRLITRVFTASQSNIIYVLDGLHSLWEIAKKDTGFMRTLEEHHYTSLYRHMLIRFPSISEDPAVVSATMEQVRDPFIVKDSLRTEAEEYLLQYLDKYAYPRYHDHLISILGAVAWLKPKNDTFRIKIEGIIRKAAFEWGDQMVVDSAEAALTSMGVLYKEPIVKLVRDSIDWNRIEYLPDTMLMQTQYGFMYLRLDTYNAPLTALNMYKLAKINFFANNYIHRVVPNFVMQLGDPSGTGDGGPGYSIRTEISPVRYDSAGVVGMASSGKDTEGSQWFITHCPTPHLNTRYTIWGEIVKGSEKIEKYQLNEQIENIIPYQ